MAQSATVHASAVLVGARAVLIRGPSGSGKSRLALELIERRAPASLPSHGLVGDDRVHLEAAGGRLLVRPAEALAGLIEVRGVGLLRLDTSRARWSAWSSTSPPPTPSGCRNRSATDRIDGIMLPRLAVAAGAAALPACSRLSLQARSIEVGLCRAGKDHSEIG
jgi:HPr kinase/phosphorylase